MYLDRHQVGTCSGAWLVLSRLVTQLCPARYANAPPTDHRQWHVTANCLLPAVAMLAGRFSPSAPPRS
jgi:hypothetical protein